MSVNINNNSQLPKGSSLLIEEFIVSPNGKYRFGITYNYELIIADADKPEAPYIVQKHTACVYLEFDGSFMLKTTMNPPQFYSIYDRVMNVYPPRNPRDVVKISLADDGLLYALDINDNILWASQWFV